MPGVAAGPTHAMAADAGELRTRVALLERGHQVSADLVAGGFTGDQCDAERARAERADPVERAREELAEAGVIGPEDLSLFTMVETAEEAVAAIDGWVPS